MQNWHDYRLGYQSQNDEVQPASLPIVGNIPAWLNGSLVRNGPSKYNIGNQSFRHWFDGLAKLHKFSFANGIIRYSCKFLESAAYLDAMRNGKISSNEFATNKSTSLLESLLRPFTLALTDNANVNICKPDNRYLAMTETPNPMLFEFASLNTIGRLNYQDSFKVQLTTAHPHFDFSHNTLINIATAFGLSSQYIIMKLNPGINSRIPIATIPVKSPGYIHSFGMTDNYVILVEFPFTVNPLELLFSGKPYIENYHWHNSQPTRFFLVEKNGNLIGPIEADPCFAFHHVNAYQHASEIVIDLLAYPDCSIINSLYLDNLMAASKKLEAPQLHRYRINLVNRSINKEILFSDRLELPRINYKQCNSKDYQYVYAVGQSNENVYLDHLIKLNLASGKAHYWRQELCFPGEPVFVAKPNSVLEDDGLVLSVVLDTKEQKSFLLVLDASNMQEIARAIMPNIMPFGFHGQFYGD